MNKGQERTTIMVVDDTPGNLNLLREMLRAQDYRVLAFPDGRMALAAAAKNPPDLILLDVDMPEINGFEVCERLRADEALKEIPVIFISAMTEIKDKVRAFAVGGMDYVIKPFQFEEVHSRVETHLRLRKLQAELKRHNHHLAELVQEKVREISESQLATIHALSRLTESRDDQTGSHIERTQSFCRLLAEQLRQNPRYAEIIDDTFVDNIYHASPLHDIGKVGIPDSILLKPDKLTPEEFEIMKGHVVIGVKTLQTVLSKYPQNTFLAMGIDIAQGHHERWDGSGYPVGQAGEAIPLSARIMAIADVYDALLAKRPYKKPFTHEKSVEIIQEGAGTHFDPSAVDAFLVIADTFKAVHEAMNASD